MNLSYSLGNSYLAHQLVTQQWLILWSQIWLTKRTSFGAQLSITQHVENCIWWMHYANQRKISNFLTLIPSHCSHFCLPTGDALWTVTSFPCLHLLSLPHTNWALDQNRNNHRKLQLVVTTGSKHFYALTSQPIHCPWRHCFKPLLPSYSRNH